MKQTELTGDSGNKIRFQTGETETVLSGLRFPEGPAFAADGSLWLVELKGESLVHAKENEPERHWVGGEPNGIAIDKAGMIWFCDAACGFIRVFNPYSFKCRTLVTHVNGNPLAGPNDLAFDPAGNLVFTCPGNSRENPDGYVCVRMRSGEVKQITSGKYFPNGIAITPDGSYLIIAETYRHRLWKGKWDSEKGEWTDPVIWSCVEGPDGPGGPDGMAFDQDGNLYVAIYGKGIIQIVNPEGAGVDSIKLAGQNPTNCAFDIKHKGDLFITEAEKGMLQKVSTNRKGAPLFS